MPVFEYKATDASGRPVNGTLVSASLVAAADQLSKHGLTVSHVALAANAADPIPQDFVSPRERTSIHEPAPSVIPDQPPPTERRSAVVTDVLGPLFLKVHLTALLFFFRQLSAMLEAGVPIISSLETLSRQTHDPRLKSVVVELAGQVREGRNMSVGMQRYPEIFSPLMLSLIRTGEEGGMLDQALKQMANYVEREIQLRNLIRKATLYPKIVIAASIVILLAANYIIREGLHASGGISSPLTDDLTYWLVLGPLIVLLFIFFRVGTANPRVRHNYDAVLLKIPGIGSTVIEMAMAKFSRALSTLYRAGVPLPKAVKLSADACGNEYLRSRLYPASRILEDGGGITDALSSTRALTPTVLDMTHTGEQTGRIDEMLEKVADYYEEDSTVKANQLAIILGVLCFLAVAGYVAYIVIHFYATGIAPHYQNPGGD